MEHRIRLAGQTSLTTSRRLSLPLQNSIPRKGFSVSFPENEVTSTDAGSTHAVDILAFVGAQEIPAFYFETPYYLAPAPGGERLYAFLRETLRSTRKIGIACVMIQARQHLAVLVPEGQSLVLNTLRWRHDDLHPAEPDDDADEDLCILDDPARDGSGVFSLGLSGTSSRAGETGTGLAALAELNMKTKKSADILIQEMDCQSDDEDLLTDDYLELILRRRPRLPDRWANRAAAPVLRTATRSGAARQRRIRR